MRVKLSIQARRDFLDITLYLRDISPALARATKERLQQAAAKLDRFPARHPVVDGRGTRALVVAPYMVFYEIVDGSVMIARVIHANRDLTKVGGDGASQDS